MKDQNGQLKLVSFEQKLLTEQFRSYEVSIRALISAGFMLELLAVIMYVDT